MAPILSAPLVALLFWALAMALGRRLLRLLGAPLAGATPWEKAVITAAIGGALLQYLPYTLAAFGRLGVASVRIAIAVLALLLAADLARVARGLGQGLVGLAPRGMSRAALVWTALFAVLVSMMLVHAVVVGPYGDDDGYHLGAAKRWLAAGTLAYQPTYVVTNGTMGFEMLYLIGLACGGAGAAKILHLGAGLVALLGLALAGRRLSGTAAALLAVTFMLISWPLADLPHVLRQAYSDMGPCLMVMAGVLLWLLWLERADGRLLVPLALTAGLAASFKLVALPIALGWAVVLTVEVRRRQVGWRPTAAMVAKFGAVSVLPVIPWLFRTWRVTGNPVFPALSSFIPSRDWNPEVGAAFGRFMRYYGWGVAAGPRLGVPQRQALMAAAGLLVAIVAVIAYRRLADRRLQALVVFSTIFVEISLAWTGLLFRYWLPATMCVALVAAVIGAGWAGRQRWRLWPAAGLMALALGIQVAREVRHGSELAGRLRVATGARTQAQEFAGDPAWQMWSYINAETPPDARVLMGAFGTTIAQGNLMAFWVDRTTFITEAVMEAYLHFEDWAPFVQSIRKAGITHVAIYDQQFMGGRYGFTFRLGANEFPFLRRLVEQHGEKVQQYEHLQLYRLRPETLVAPL